MRMVIISVSLFPKILELKNIIQEPEFHNFQWKSLLKMRGKKKKKTRTVAKCFSPFLESGNKK